MDTNVDMLALAREVNVRDKANAKNNAIKVIAPAKVNLVLNVGDARADGYHEVSTVMHTLMLHDVLYVRHVPHVKKELGPELPSDVSGASGNVQLQIKTIMVSSDGVVVPYVENSNNLVTKAVYALDEALGRDESNGECEKTPKMCEGAEPECIEIYVEKHIPAQAGLGGGSSDAAAALLGVAKLWGVSENNPAILETAKQLGSDVAFFLQGGCAEYENKGDELVRTITSTKQNVLLVKPTAGLSTAEVYKKFDELRDAGNNTSNNGNDKSNDNNTKNNGSSNSIKNNGDNGSGNNQKQNETHSSACSIELYNNLTPAAEEILPELKTIREWLETQPETQGTILCGSGSCLCVMCESFESAIRLSASPRLQNYWTRTTSLANLKATVAPK